MVSHKHCTSPFSKQGQLWKASSAIHWLNFIKHILGRGKYLSMNRQHSCILPPCNCTWFANVFLQWFLVPNKFLQCLLSNNSCQTCQTTSLLLAEWLRSHLLAPDRWVFVPANECHKKNMTSHRVITCPEPKNRLFSFLLLRSHSEKHHSAWPEPGTVTWHWQYSEWLAQEHAPPFVGSEGWQLYTASLSCCGPTLQNSTWKRDIHYTNIF